MLCRELRAKPGHGLELAVRIADQSDDDASGAGGDVAAQELGGTLAGPGIARLSPAHHGSRLTVIVLEKRIDPLVGAARILLDGPRRIDRSYKLTDIAPRLTKDLLHLGPLLLPPAEVGLVGEPAVEMPGRAFEGGADRACHPD